MAQLRELIVSGPSRFVGASTFNDDVVLNKGATSYADIIPGETSTHSLGDATYRWKNLYITNINMSDTLTTSQGEASTSASTGDIQVAGGIGVAKNSFFKANIYLGSTTYYVNGSTSNLNALTTAGLITSGGNVVPGKTTLTLGTSSSRWATIYLKDANATGNIVPNASSNSQTLGTSSNRWNGIYGNTVYFGGTTYYISGTAANLPATTVAGLTVAGDLLPSANGAYTLGSSSKRWLTLFVGNGAEGTAANTGAVQITGGLSTTKKSFMGDTLVITGDIDIQGANADRFINFTHTTASDTGYDWRTGVLGTGSGDANYYVIQSNSTSGTWANVLRLGLTTYDAQFSGNVVPAATSSKNLGSSSLKWNHVYAVNMTATTFNGSLNGNASSASKLGTNAGSSTRPVYFASGIPVQCGDTLAVNISKNAATATLASSATRLAVIDDRSENPTPNEVDKGLSLHLKANGADDLSDGSSYHAVINIKDWQDYSGGPWSQLATTANGLWYRISADKDTWGNWYKTAVQNGANTFSGNNTFSGSNKFTGPATFTGAVTIDGMKNGYCHEWIASIKGVTWSRLCYVVYGGSIIGASYILNIGATRGNVVYNDTYLIKPHHSKNGAIIKIGGHKYSTGYQVRLLADSSGSSYVEIYDNCQSATTATTQKVYCRLIPIFTGAVTKYTEFTDGTTLPDGFSVVKTLTANSADIQADVSGKNNIYYVTGNSTGTAGKWTGTNTQIPSLYTGLTIAYKIQLAGSSSGVTLNLTTAEGATGEKTVRRNDSSLTTHLPAGSVVILTYDGTYWRWADYDANSYAKVRQYSSTTNGNYPLIFRYTNNAINAGSYVTDYLSFDSDSGLYANPSSGTLGATYVFLKSANPYLAFQDSAGTTQGYVQYVESTDNFAIGTNMVNSLQVSATGSISIPASQTITPRTTNTGSVGTSALKWNKIYATTFVGDLDGNAKTATSADSAATASKLSTGAAGNESTPVYFTSGGIPTKLTATVGSSLGPVYMKSGTITACAISAAKNRWGVLTSIGGDGVMEVGKYIDFHTADENEVDYDVRISASTDGLTITGVTSGSFKGSLDGNAKTATNATTASKLGTNAGGTAKPVYFASGIPVALSATVGGVAKPVYLNAGTITACSSTVGSTTKPVYMSSGTITASNATVGSSSRPMYLNAGTMTAVTAVGTAYGGTGSTSQTANRVVYTNSSGNIVSSAHFASSVKMAINSTTEPATTFHVEGTANVDGALSLDSKVKFVYNSTDESLDFIFV